MAVSAKFVADLSNFEQAVQKGVVRLKDFSSQVGRVDKDLAKFGNQFSGNKIIADAQLAAKAIESIGGVSKLTANEQSRLNSVVSEALAKYKALGIDAPKHLLDIEKATRQVDTATAGISTKMIAIGTAIGTFVGKLAVDAVKALGREVVDLATNGIKLAPIVTSFERLTTSIGESGDAMIDVTRTATKGLVKDLDIMQSANKAILLGLPVTAKEFGTLASAATALGKAMGQDATKSLDDLITALGRSSPLILDNLGLTVKVGEANDAYAKKLGKTAEQLTDGEKKLAFYNAAVDAAKTKMDALGGVQLTLADQLTRLKIGFTNFTDALGVAIARSPVLNELLGGLADAMDGAFGGNQVSRVQSLIKVINSGAVSLVNFGIVAVDVASGVNDAFKLMTDAVSGNFLSMFSLLTSHMKTSVSQMIAIAAAVHKLDPTGMVAESTLKTLVALRAAMEGGKTTNNEFGKTLDKASGSLWSLRERLIEAGKRMVDNADIAGALAKQTDSLATSTDKAAKVADQLYSRDVIEKANAYAKAIGDVANISKLSKEKQAEVTAVLNEAIDAQRRLQLQVSDTFKALQAALQPLDKMQAELRELETVTDNTKDALQELGRIPPPLDAMQRDLQKLETTFSTTGINGLLTNLGDELKEIGKIGDRVPTILGRITNGLRDLWKGMSDGKGVSGLFQNLGDSLIQGFGNIISGGITTVVNKGIELAWSGIKKLGGLIKGLFGGPSQQELEGREAVKQFEAEIAKLLTQTQKLEAGNERWKQTVVLVRDAYLATGRSAEQAERDVKRLWDSSVKGAEEAKRVAEEINAVLMEQQADVERLNAAIEKYGFTIEELGPAMRAQQLNDQAKELIEDWRVLVASGIDVSLVNEKMSQAMNDYLNIAIRTGSEVPAAMKPILESLAAQGQLRRELTKQEEQSLEGAKKRISEIDSLLAQGQSEEAAAALNLELNKQKNLVDELSDTSFKSLEDAGVRFAETMTEGFDRVVLKLDELIKRLQGAGLAIGNIPAIDIPVNLPDIEQQLQARYGGRSAWNWFGGDGAIPMAAGGAGTVTKPTLFMAGEAGPEQFAFSGAGKSFSGGDTRALQAEVAGLREDLARQQRDLPRALKIAMQDALALA